jgi:uncharacterized membrane protein YedE/YeeE
MECKARPFWPPLISGIALGLALFITFMITGHGMGASGFFTRLTAGIAGALVPDWAMSNAYFAPFLRNGANPLSSWISWEIIGIMLGALAGSLTSGRFRLMIEKGKNASTLTRLSMAFSGGILVGIGARFARGCTSGVGLSGGATLAVAGFIFLIFFFLSGYLVNFLTRRAWS